jgi:predicted ATPase
MVFVVVESIYMHINRISLHPEKYPTRDHYPFNLPIFHQTRQLTLDSPVTFFIGENGIHIWRSPEGMRYKRNPYEKAMRYFVKVEWTDGRVPGSYFSSDNYRYFSFAVDEWAASDANQLNYFGGKSLVTQSHGQSLMSFFSSRYKIRGLYLLDEPETALSPKSQLERSCAVHHRHPLPDPAGVSRCDNLQFRLDPRQTC